MRGESQFKLEPLRQICCSECTCVLGISGQKAKDKVLFKTSTCGAANAAAWVRLLHEEGQTGGTVFGSVPVAQEVSDLENSCGPVVCAVVQFESYAPTKILVCIFLLPHTKKV